MIKHGLRKKLVGTVVSTQMDKSALVLVERLMKHRTYGKYLRRRAKYVANDPQNKCRIGDKVRIIESRPISKTKKWRIIDVIDKTSS